MSKFRKSYIEKTLLIESKGLDAKDATLWIIRHREHVRHASERGLKSYLSLGQYLDKVVEAGIKKPNEIGVQINKKQLSRIGDIGDYTVENCRFITKQQNAKEAYTNGRHTLGIERKRIRQLGQTKDTLDQYRKVSNTLRGRTAKTHAYMAEGAMKRTGRTKETHAYLNEISKKMKTYNKQNRPGIARRSELQAKEYTLIDPTGNIHTIKNLTEFCKINNLSQPHMSSVSTGKRKHHKGWTILELDGIHLKRS